MGNNTKVFAFVVLFVAIVSLACGGSTTPAAKGSPIPTIAKTPGVLECSDIVTAHNGVTDLQWEAYKTSVQGKDIYFTGSVSQVNDDGSVLVSGSSCVITLFNVPHNIAIALSKGQNIEGYGTINGVSYFLVVDIEINIKPDLLIVY